MTDKACNHGIRWVEGDTPTSRRPDYSEACGQPATGRSMSGHPRCDTHKARRWVVAVGTSITVTRQIYDTADQACDEVLRRLGESPPSAIAPDYMRRMHEAHLARMSARPATDTDVERFEAFVSQTVESVSVAGSPR